MAEKLSPEIPARLLGKIIDEVFNFAIEDPGVIEDIYRVIAKDVNSRVPAFCAAQAEQKAEPDIPRVIRYDDSVKHGYRPQPAHPADVRPVPRELLEWAVERWHAEVSERPLVNVHRRTLDDTWRQVIAKLGGDHGLLCGPRHDDLLAASQGEV